MKPQEIAKETANYLAVQIGPTLESILAEMTSLKDEIAVLKGAKAYKTVTDIMSEFGYTRTTILRSPWLMPNWGKSDLPGRVRKWRFETYRLWFAQPMASRQMEWDRLPIKEKTKLSGKVTA